jgi:hypothetical protein
MDTNPYAYLFGAFHHRFNRAHVVEQRNGKSKKNIFLFEVL